MKSRRGISSVVGSVFAIIALATTVGYISYSMDILNNYNQSVLARNQQAVDFANEKFQVGSVTIVNNKFNITIVNVGSLPVNFTKMWVTDKSVTNWVKSYVPNTCQSSPPSNPARRCLVAPGNTLINLGQDASSSLNLNSNHAYHVKLVTSRGNTNEFDVNSAATAPLSIQFFAAPSTVASGFKTTLIMLVTNNGTGVLTNLTPNALPTPSYTGSGSASCQAGAVSPSNYNTLPPGSTAVFKWDVTASGYGGDTCKYTVTQPLQNGLTQTLTQTITITSVTLASTTFSQNAGLITIDYATWKYSSGSGWQASWAVPSNTKVVFSMTVTNNNSTGTLWISKKTAIMMTAGTAAPTYIYLINATNPNVTPPTVTASCTSNDFCISVNPGQSITMYFGSDAAAGSNTQSTPNQQRPATGFILLYGKFATSPSANGPWYAQNIPYIAINLT